VLRERESKARKTLAFSCFCGERHDDDDSRAFLLLNAACPRVAPQPRPLYFLPLPLCVFHSRTHSFLEYTPHTGTDEDDRDGGRRLKITFLASQTIISLLPPSLAPLPTLRHPPQCPDDSSSIATHSSFSFSSSSSLLPATPFSFTWRFLAAAAAAPPAAAAAEAAGALYVQLLLSQ